MVFFSFVEGYDMTQNEIIEMARQAGFVEKDAMFRSVYLANIKDLEAYAKLVAEKEREACATMSDWILKEGGGTWGDAIRKRK
jgi:hypothetical protein